MNQLDIQALITTLEDHHSAMLSGSIESDRNKIIRLFYKALFEVASVDYLIVKRQKVRVKNGMGLLPCDMIRLLSIFDEEVERFDYSRNGHFAFYPRRREGIFTVEYYALPVVEQNIDGQKVYAPLIQRLQVDYLINYVALVYAENGFIEGKVSGAVVQMIQQKKDEAYYMAVGSSELVSVDDMLSALDIMQNGFYKTRP